MPTTPRTERSDIGHVPLDLPGTRDLSASVSVSPAARAGTAAGDPDPADPEHRLVADIERCLLTGEWRAGDRLPTERDLSATYGLGRTRVRRVLATFEHAGRITRTIGRGTFVADVSASPGLDDAEVETLSPEELMETRLLLEPQIAALAVRRASLADLAKLRELAALGRRSRSMADFEDIDHRFHLALATAAKNRYLAGLVARMHTLRRSAAWSSLRRRGLTADRRRTYQAQHETIVAALEARDAEAARNAIRSHLEDVRQNLWLDGSDPD